MAAADDTDLSRRPHRHLPIVRRSAVISKRRRRLIIAMREGVNDATEGKRKSKMSGRCSAEPAQ